MRSAVNWLGVLGCGALLAFAAPAAPADDAVVVTAHQRIRIGSLALEPGSYLLRAPSGIPTRNVVVVTSPDGMKFYGFVLATHESGHHMTNTTDKVVVSEKDNRTVQAWVVAWKDTGYTFSSAPVPPALAASARAAFPLPSAAR
jgi:hypothetical protein